MTTMTTDDQIRDEKLQHDINREASKISALSPSKFNEYEYLTGEVILPSNQNQMMQQAKFTYSPLGKAFGKEIKTIEDEGDKQFKIKGKLKQLINILMMMEIVHYFKTKRNILKTCRRKTS